MLKSGFQPSFCSARDAFMFSTRPVTQEEKSGQQFAFPASLTQFENNTVVTASDLDPTAPHSFGAFCVAHNVPVPIFSVGMSWSAVFERFLSHFDKSGIAGSEAWLVKS